MGHRFGNHRAIEGTQDFLVCIIAQINNINRPSSLFYVFFELGPRAFACYVDIDLCDIYPARVKLIILIP